MENRIVMTPRYTIYLTVIELAQELFGKDKITDFDVNTEKLPVVRVEEGIFSKNDNKDEVGTVTIPINMFSTTGFAQRTELDIMLAELYGRLEREELPDNDLYNVQVATINVPAPRRDGSTGQT